MLCIMKKINIGSGKDIEISEDVTEDVDPDSMFSESIPEVNNKDSTLLETIPENQIITVAYFSNEEKEFQIIGLFEEIKISNKDLEYEFLMLKKHFYILLQLNKIELHKIVFLSNDKEHEFNTEIRIIKKIEFKSFGKRIRCRIFA